VADLPLDPLRRLHEETKVPPAERVTQVDKGFGPVDVLGHADTTELLLRSDPEWNWEPPTADELARLGFDSALVRDADGWPRGLWIALTVHGHRRLGFGTCAPKKPDAVKELIGDAIRNAAMRFGVALSLWSKAEWAEGEPAAEVTPLHPTPSAEDKARHPSAAQPLPQGRLLAEAAARAGFTPPKGASEEEKADVDRRRRDVLELVTGKRSSTELTSAQDVKKALDTFDAIANGFLVPRYEDGALYLAEAEPAS
jgi:hypothetical protein